ncbi:hypothetical protein D3C72_1995840 [compost metagenome]
MPLELLGPGALDPAASEGVELAVFLRRKLLPAHLRQRQLALVDVALRHKPLTDREGDDRSEDGHLISDGGVRHRSSATPKPILAAP